MAPSASPQSEGARQRPKASELGNPIPRVKVDLTDDDFRESAYEILLAYVGTTALSARSVGSARSKVDKSMTAVAASRMKKALGLKTKAASYKRTGKARTTAELMRDQMQIAEAVDMRTRRALSRAAATQASNKRMLVPLELLQNIPASTFSDNGEHSRWLKRQLRVLEAGLLAHPLVRGEAQSVEALRLRQCLKEMYSRGSDTGKNTESIQALRSAAMTRAMRPCSNETDPDSLHWVDGYPLNVNLYAALLSACFDAVEEGTVLEELDDLMEMIRKTWGVLGVDNLTHNMLFMWLLFKQYVVTSEADLLGAAESQMAEVVKEYKSSRPEQWNLLHAILTTVQSWAERRLLAYHDSFPEEDSGSMAKILSLAVQSAEIIGDYDIFIDKKRRQKTPPNIVLGTVDLYVRSSIRTAFAQMMEEVDSRRKASGEAIPALAQLAEDTLALSTKELEVYSPMLKEWHPYAGGVAAVTLHACYTREIKQYMSGVTALTPDTLQVLQAADQLEKALVQIAVEEGAEAEDGGKALIREMPPFEGDRVIGDLAKKWVQERLQMLGEMVARNVEQEKWEPHSLKERFAPSALDLLRIVDETLVAYFALPVSQFQDLLQELVNGIDVHLQTYATEAIGSCGSKDALIPPIPPLTRCKTKKSWFGKGKHEGKGARARPPLRKPQASDEIYNLPHLCVRMNTLHYLNSEVDSVEKKVRFGFRKEPSPMAMPSMHPSEEAVDSNLYRTRGLLKEGIESLMEIAAYRVVFVDMRPVLWDGLYVGGVGNARISVVIDELDVQLGVISESSAERLRNRVIGALMRACFEGLMLVLMAAGPSRWFTLGDAALLQEDLKSLKDLFIADGDGLPAEKVDREASLATEIVSLFSLPTNELIQRFHTASGSGKGGAVKVAFPQTTGNWSKSDPDTLLRVLCYRGDDAASKYLKKTFRLPKNE